MHEPAIDLGFDPLAVISEHCEGIASVAAGHLDAPVEHCPGWDVAELLEHLIGVHWFWATIADERLSEPPGDDRRPAPPARDDLVAAFLAGAERLVDVLGRADQSERVWTWAPAQQDIAFITRHQVQEAAVHHFDAANAGGAHLVIAADVAIDCIDEFLTFSVSSDDDPAEPERPSLGGRLVLQSSGAGPGWTIGEGRSRGTTSFARGADADVPTVTGSPSELLLWLYGRVALDVGHVPPDLVARFRGLCYTD